MCASSVAPSCPPLCNPLDCSPPGSSVHGILQVRILGWVAMPSSRGFLTQGLNQVSSWYFIKSAKSLLPCKARKHSQILGLAHRVLWEGHHSAATQIMETFAPCILGTKRCISVLLRSGQTYERATIDLFYWWAWRQNILNKIAANEIQQYLCSDWVHFRSRRVVSEGIPKSFDIMCYIKRLKKSFWSSQ